jgi:enoyl-CoA hydratase/carnithine racemase
MTKLSQHQQQQNTNNTPTTTTKTLKTIIIERRGDVEIVTLNRPKVLNAINPDMMNELLHYFTNLESAWYDSAVAAKLEHVIMPPRVIILKANGKGFCSGADLADSDPNMNENVAAALAVQRKFSEIMIKMRRIPQPIISLLHGATAGGGLALALASDIRYCTSEPPTRFAVSMATVGFSGCDLGISYFLPRIVGVGKASEMMLTGKFINTNEAKEMRLVNDVFQSMEQMTIAGDMLARDMLKLTSFALPLTKQGINASLSASSLETQVYLEDRQQILTSLHPEFRTKVMEFFSRPRDNNNNKGQEAKL